MDQDRIARLTAKRETLRARLAQLAEDAQRVQAKTAAVNGQLAALERELADAQTTA